MESEARWAGTVYVYSVSSLPDHVKVGFTRRQDVDQRIREYMRQHRLTGSYVVHANLAADRPYRVEQMFHYLHMEDRGRKGQAREFFVLPPETAITSLKRLIHEPGDVRGIPSRLRGLPENNAADIRAARQQRLKQQFLNAKRLPHRRRITIKVSKGEEVVIFRVRGHLHGIVRWGRPGGEFVYFRDLDHTACQIVEAMAAFGEPVDLTEPKRTR